MKIILSPTKKMKEDRDSLAFQALPDSLSKTRQILSRLLELSPEDLQSLWRCNDSIAKQNIERLCSMDLTALLTPALLAYEGIAFQYMAPTVFSDRELQYVQEHLRILSGFYGVLRPLDGVRSYRLEMQAPLQIGSYQDLYDFWGRDLYDGVRDSSGIILNLASKEYSKCIQPYLTADDRLITCIFGENVSGKLRQKGTFAKMARGEMVRYLAENQAGSPEVMKGFDRLDFHFLADCSTDTQYVFERRPS